MSSDIYKSKKMVFPAEQKGKKILFIRICSILLGVLFVFSGFVKAIDPLGTTYKIEDYLNAFGSPFSQFVFLAFPAAVFLSTWELVMGLNLLLRIYVRFTTWVAAVFLFFMTLLTFYIALKNPVTDCGCFGEAIVLTNWQTFIKNIFFIALSTFLLINRKHLYPLVLPSLEAIFTVSFVIVGIGISVYSYFHLPIMDFRPYKVGVNIPEAMKIPEGAKPDVYETTFIYEKEGKQKEFNLENYPKNDKSWKFVDQKTKLISKGYRPPIHDFTILNNDNEDISDIILSQSDSTFLLIMYDINKTSQEGAKKAERIFQKAQQNGHSFYAITASTDNDIQKFTERTKISFPFYKADPIILKTVIRANPGLVLIKDGTILGKWNWRDFPENFY